jgi:TetR/AcrR family transcriptional repressor of nem operon
MRLTKADREQNHTRILAAAAQLFREKGVDGTGLDEIMAKAGLTHGAFYSHFKSKAALVAEATDYGFTEAFQRLFPEGEGQPRSIAEFADRYLSPNHRHHPEFGCVAAAIGADIGRQDAAAKATFARRTEDMVDHLTVVAGGGEAARRRAVLAVSAAVGAMVVMRGAGSAAISDDFLSIVRDGLKTAL